MVVDNDRPEGSKFRISGKGVEQEPKGFFKIIENTGEVTVTRPLDREVTATYQIEEVQIGYNRKQCRIASPDS
ncbi:UNVERIFIED_CONTAM: Cadherin-13 [Gekko kuhli]